MSGMVITQHREPELQEETSQPAKQQGILRYNSPLAQVFLIGLVCFCCPGMFNALTGLGGGGQLNHTTVDNANTVLYACFAIFGVLGGAAYNLLGPRTTLLVGALTYPLYAASFLYYNHHGSEVFPIVAGGVLGGLFPFSFNYHRGDKPASVNDGTYIAFIAFMLLGAALSLFILPPTEIVRDDGSKATRFIYSSLAIEGTEILRLFTNWKMLLVLPAAWDSNFFYTYQFNNVNGVLFTLRTQGLNNIFYWGARMIGSVSIGYLLDFGFASRRKRGLVGVVVVAVLGSAIWGGGLANQLKYKDGKWDNLIDFKDGRRYAGPFLLFFSYGLLDAMFQSLVYWIIGALANDSQVISRYVGFYNAVQSAGAAVAWQIDRHKTPLICQLILNWGLMTISYPLLGVLVMFAVKDEDN
ncbi:hypothetical protein QOZ80_5AG0390180 [Eleusine coracana subsp. coracana]|nr:hypothetical protein QOZ80_5AG0390180 [Eleusine coracana subsp. coracana]